MTPLTTHPIVKGGVLRSRKSLDLPRLSTVAKIGVVSYGPIRGTVGTLLPLPHRPFRYSLLTRTTNLLSHTERIHDGD